MARTQDDGSRGTESIDAAIEARLHSIDAGNYRATNRRILAAFADFLRSERGVTGLDELDVVDCRRYAQYLRRRVRDDDDPLSAASASAQGPYFTVVRAFLSWCVADERLDANPAEPNRVREALPEDLGDYDRQFWSRDVRDAIVAYADERAHDALSADDADRREAFRDRAVVSMLAMTGVRGAELFADPNDERRNGLQWEAVDLDDGVATVLGKTREHQAVSLVEDVCRRLDRWKTVQDPPSDDWPVVPTRHRPTLARTARETLDDRGWSADEIESVLDDNRTRTVFRAEEIAPPAMTKEGGRSLMKRLSADADLEIDGEYLKPHGGRRGLGHDVYEADAELAQETLRHQSLATTHESYREQQAKKRRERLEDVLAEPDE